MKHGHGNGTRTYNSWANMLRRCRGQSTPEHYTERGIALDDPRWESFEAFLHDMGVRPEGKTLERKDNDKGYSKDNCRWATPVEQARNRRSTHRIAIGDKTLSLTEWAEVAGISWTQIKARYAAGDRGERLIRPPRSGKHKRP